MTSSGTTPSLHTVRDLAKRHSNRARWGADDQRGTLNHVSPGHEAGGVEAPELARLRVMPLQAGTQWDALTHIVFDVRQGSEGMVGRGVLLDVARTLGVDWLEPGHAIGSGSGPGRGCSKRGGRPRRLRVRAHRFDRPCSCRGCLGDLERTGAGPRAGQRGLDRRTRGRRDGDRHLGLRGPTERDARCHAATAHHPAEPNGAVDGEIFDLEAIAANCAADGRYEFFFCGPPLPFTRAVGIPLNPMAI